MKCTNCGNEVPETANVCGYCGHRLKSIPAAMASVKASVDIQPASNVKPILTTRPLAEANKYVQGQTTQWGPREWFLGALIWGIFSIPITLGLKAALYFLFPENQAFSFNSIFFNQLGNNLLFGIINWVVPGVLIGYSRKVATPVIIGLIASLSLGVLFTGSWENALYVGLAAAPSLGAMIVVWTGSHGLIHPGFPSALRWLLLGMCGIILGLQLHPWNNIGFNSNYVWSIVGIGLAIVVGFKEQKYK
jgi:DNA-directed RNA polymerase subunit RPC12/RpoP